MANYPKMLITNAGLDMIAESAADSKAIIFTRVKLGDGVMPADGSVQTMTDVIASKLVALISSGAAQGNGQTKLRFAVSNATLNTGFFAREIGLFAKVGDNGAESLYAYTNGGNYVDYVPDKTNPLDAQIVDIYVVTSNAAEVRVDASTNAYVTTADLAEHNTSASAHAAVITAHNGDNNAHSTLFGKYLPLAGGTCTGAVYAPTAAAGTNNTQVATTAFVTAAGGSYVSKAGDTMTGGLTAPTVTATAMLNIPGGRIWIG